MGSQSITEYMNAIRVCVDQLAILGDPYKLKDLIERVLEGLQDSNYQVVIDATNARDSLITFDELHEKLIIREVRLRTQTSSTPLPATALATSTRNFHPPTTQNHNNQPTSTKNFYAPTTQTYNHP